MSDLLTCSDCGQHFVAGTGHICPMKSSDIRVAIALERIADMLEELRDMALEEHDV